MEYHKTKDILHVKTILGHIRICYRDTRPKNLQKKEAENKCETLKTNP
jgi:hypothetical protein